MISLNCRDGDNFGNPLYQIGNIAGVSTDGTLESNYFVSDLWGGVDQINYIGKAQRCTYEELIRNGNSSDRLAG